jgi:hypothetical protein
MEILAVSAVGPYSYKHFVAEDSSSIWVDGKY